MAVVSIMRWWFVVWVTEEEVALPLLQLPISPGTVALHLLIRLYSDLFPFTSLISPIITNTSALTLKVRAGQHLF